MADDILEEQQYLYCIIKCAQPRRFAVAPVGGSGGDVYTVHYMDLAAVCSHAGSDRYDISRHNTMAHELVVERVMQEHVVLPVRFGTVARNASEIQERLLKRRFGEFHGYLRHLDDKVELGLKVLWDRAAILTTIAATEEPIRRLRDYVLSRPERETRYQRIELGGMVEEAMIRKRDEEASRQLAELRPLAAEVRVNKPLTDVMVLNAAFLVEKEKELAFDAAVQRIAAAGAPPLNVKYVGPLPPFNFVNVVVHWDRED